MTTETRAIGWDCPLTMDDIDGESLAWIDDDDRRAAAVEVSKICNWFREQDQALARLVMDGDLDRLRDWRDGVLDGLPQAVTDGGADPADEESIGWMHNVQEAWDALIATIE